MLNLPSFFFSEILKILLRDESLAPEVDLKELAKKTESFSGSDLKRMSKLARCSVESCSDIVDCHPDLCVSAALDAVKENVTVPWAAAPAEKEHTTTTH